MSWDARVESPDYEWVPRVISHVIDTTPSSDATNLLRVCRQVHSEFAVWLYSMPFEFRVMLPGLYKLPISTTYQHLVRRVHIYCTRNAYWKAMRRNFHWEWSVVPDIWRSVLKCFPGVRTIRITWDDHSIVETELQAWVGRGPGSRGDQVKKCEKHIKCHQQLKGHGPIPQQVELYLRSNEPDVLIDAPICEAIRNLRRTPRKKIAAVLP